MWNTRMTADKLMVYIIQISGLNDAPKCTKGRSRATENEKICKQRNTLTSYKRLTFNCKAANTTGVLFIEQLTVLENGSKKSSASVDEVHAEVRWVETQRRRRSVSEYLCMHQSFGCKTCSTTDTSSKKESVQRISYSAKKKSDLCFA